MSTENLEYKNSMDRLESILERIDNSEMGIDELSVSPTFVLKVRDAVRKIDLSE